MSALSSTAPCAFAALRFRLLLNARQAEVRACSPRSHSSPSSQALRGFSRNSGEGDGNGKEKKGEVSLLQRLMGVKAGDTAGAAKVIEAESGSSESGTKSGSGESETKGGSIESGTKGGSKALVVSGPERKHHKVFVVELGRKPLFPGIYTPVLVSKNERLIKEITELKQQGAQAYVGAFLRRPETNLSPSDELADALLLSDAGSHLYDVGTFAQVHTVMTGDTPDSAQLLLLGHRRIKRKDTLIADPLKVRVEHLKDEPYDKDDIVKATSMEIVHTMRDLLSLNPLYGEQFRTLLSLTGSIDLQDMSRLVDAAASLTSADEATLQSILDELSVPDRAQAVLLLLKKEVELCKLQQDIRDQVESKIMKEQKRQMLMEQLKSIKKELGLEKDDKSALVQKFTERWESKKAIAPPEALRVVEEELGKLSALEPASPEFNVTRNYLEWLTSLPWGTYSDEIFNIVHAKEVLDADHHGLDDVKERILEFIAVSSLRGSAQGKIICLVGPPGVGKTSIGRSIANTLGRKYHRFSVGGLYDVAEIKGHRRTYVGAMPGKIVQCLKSTGTSNPLILIDEIDKLGRGHTGDPASALLELLDPEQNATFMDHYMDVPIDVSKVLFVCTANVLDTIPGPLLDRMEVIRLSGYAADEKRSIARKYLEPQVCDDAGVPKGAVHLDDSAMDSLINEYCREAGVRNLKKHLEKIYRKSAFKLVQSGYAAPPTPPSTTTAAAPLTVAPSDTTLLQSITLVSSLTDESGTPSKSGSTPVSGEVKSEDKAVPIPYTGDPILVSATTLKDFCGQAPFSKDNFYETTPPGVVMGLAWTSMGGSTLYIEAAKVHGGESKGSLIITGQLGDVFKESVSIAHTFARAFLQDHDPTNTFFSSNALHVHVPAGATPKDGPSAGCTLITALLSLALHKPVTADLAMTGEVTLTGRVLPIGGVKEKLLAARRSGVKKVIFPEGNKSDYDELSDEIRGGIEAHFVGRYEQIYALALA